MSASPMLTRRRSENEPGILRYYRTLREHIVPAIRSMPGFQSGTWLTGNDDGKGLSLTLWDDEGNARAMAERFGIGSSPAMNAMTARCELREVAATA